MLYFCMVSLCICFEDFLKIVMLCVVWSYGVWWKGVSHVRLCLIRLIYSGIHWHHVISPFSD